MIDIAGKKMDLEAGRNENADSIHPNLQVLCQLRNNLYQRTI